jgi:hypothetical protein
VSEMRERVARALAKRHGDNWDDIPDHKGHWVKERGYFGGRFRDVNERFRCDYLDDAEAAIEAMREPTDAIKAMSMCNDFAERLWPAMIDAALSAAKGET